MKKGLNVNIYKPHYGDSSNGGISSQFDQAVVIDPSMPEIFEADKDSPALKLVRRNIGGSVYIHAEPVDPCPSNQVGYMFGGCFVYTSDSRFRNVCQYPIPLHDRSETQEEYDILSR